VNKYSAKNRKNRQMRREGGGSIKNGQVHKNGGSGDLECPSSVEDRNTTCYNLMGRVLAVVLKNCA
jgi:hypothetical protein